MNSYQEFCEYFDELENLGISFGLSDLYQKAKELEIEPPQEFKRN